MERNKLLDRLRGIGCLVILISHLITIQSIDKFFTAMHIPLHFFLSGINHNPIKFRSFVKKKARSLLIPYAWFSLLSAFVGWILFPVGMFTIISGFIYGHPYNNGALWFLPSLFICSLLSYYVLKKNIFVALYVSLVGFLSMMLPQLPFSFTVSTSCSLFYVLGSKYHHIFKKRMSNFALPLLMILYVFVVISNGFINVNARIFQNPILFLIGSLLGIVLTYQLAIRFNSAIIEYIGKHALWVFGLHFLFIESFNLKII